MPKPCVLTKNMLKPHVYYQPLLICHYSWYTITWAINPYRHRLLCPSKYSTRLTVSSLSCAWYHLRLSVWEYTSYKIVLPIVVTIKRLRIRLIELVSIYLIVDLLIWSIYICSGRSTTWSCILGRRRIWNGSDGKSLKVVGERNRNNSPFLLLHQFLIQLR
jgi:hypothetical protein